MLDIVSRIVLWVLEAELQGTLGGGNKLGRLVSSMPKAVLNLFINALHSTSTSDYVFYLALNDITQYRPEMCTLH